MLGGTKPGTQHRYILPGDAHRSLVYHAVVRPAEHPAMMPGDGWGLNAGQERQVREWIEAGAAWPAGRAGRLRERPLQVEFDDYL